MKKSIAFFVVTVAGLAVVACSSMGGKTAPVGDVFTKEKQAELTPDRALELLKEGNERFVNNDMTVRNHNSQVRKAVSGQYPKAIVLSCVDSRVPVEDVFDRGIGDVFVARVAGNFVNEDILGSMEFATKVAGSKLIVVMGHEHCGAVKAAVDGVKLGNITSLVNSIKPAVRMTSSFEGEKSSKNPEYVSAVCKNNVKNTISQIRKRSKIIRDLEKGGDIKIVGAMYDMDTGRVDFY
tara:strand:- start:1201 stop:1911 length:711 start_codon:yes stop_codon:yes gene_type:complete